MTQKEILEEIFRCKQFLNWSESNEEVIGLLTITKEGISDISLPKTLVEEIIKELIKKSKKTIKELEKQVTGEYELSKNEMCRLRI